MNKPTRRTFLQFAGSLPIIGSIVHERPPAFSAKTQASIPAGRTGRAMGEEGFAKVKNLNERDIIPAGTEIIYVRRAFDRVIIAADCTL